MNLQALFTAENFRDNVSGSQEDVSFRMYLDGGMPIFATYKHGKRPQKIFCFYDEAQRLTGFIVPDVRKDGTINKWGVYVVDSSTDKPVHHAIMVKKDSLYEWTEDTLGGENPEVISDSTGNHYTLQGIAAAAQGMLNGEMLKREEHFVFWDGKSRFAKEYQYQLHVSKYGQYIPWAVYRELMLMDNPCTSSPYKNLGMQVEPYAKVGDYILCNGDVFKRRGGVFMVIQTEFKALDDDVKYMDLDDKYSLVTEVNEREYAIVPNITLALAYAGDNTPVRDAREEILRMAFLSADPHTILSFGKYFVEEFANSSEPFLPIEGLYKNLDAEGFIKGLNAIAGEFEFNGKEYKPVTKELGLELFLLNTIENSHPSGPFGDLGMKTADHILDVGCVEEYVEEAKELMGAEDFVHGVCFAHAVYAIAFGNEQSELFYKTVYPEARPMAMRVRWAKSKSVYYSDRNVNALWQELLVNMAD